MRTPTLRSQGRVAAAGPGPAPGWDAAPFPVGAPGPLRHSPPNRVRPPDPGATSPVMQRIKVLFPAPLGPRSTNREPRGTVRSRPRKASTLPLPDLKVTRRSRASRTGEDATEVAGGFWLLVF